MHTDFFQRERELIHAAEGTLERDDLAPEVRQPFTDLLAGFRRLLNQCRRLLSMGDRMQAQLNELNREIAAKEARYRTIFANAAEGVFRCTDKGEIAEANPALAAIFGFDDPDHLLRETGRLGRLFKQRADRRLYEKLLRETGGVQRFEAAMRRRDGTTLWVQLSTQALGEADGARCGASHVGVVLDVTEHRRMLAELSHMANTDGLTDLCNRRHFMELARRELERSRRTGAPLSLVMGDVDHFKRVNDTWGHDTGDEVLRALARTMRACFREVDVIARLGGEEFAILLPDADRVSARRAAERFRRAVEIAPVRHGKQRIPVTLSLGLTTLRPDAGPGRRGAACDLQAAAMDLDALLKNGDIALYAAKKNGRNRLESFPCGNADEKACAREKAS